MIKLGKRFSKYGNIRVYWKNGVYIGDFTAGDGGYYYFWPELKAGCASAYYLRCVADKLDELNEEWDAIIQADPNI